jgi:hypothetical protein
MKANSRTDNVTVDLTLHLALLIAILSIKRLNRFIFTTHNSFQGYAHPVI